MDSEVHIRRGYLQLASAIAATLLMFLILIHALAPSDISIVNQRGSAFSASTIDVSLPPARRTVVEVPAKPTDPLGAGGDTGISATLAVLMAMIPLWLICFVLLPVRLDWLAPRTMSRLRLLAPNGPRAPPSY